MLCREIIVICSELLTKTYIRCVAERRILNVKNPAVRKETAEF